MNQLPTMQPARSRAQTGSRWEPWAFFLALAGEGGGGLGEGGGGGEVGFAEVGEAHGGVEERGAVGAGDFVVAGVSGAWRSGGVAPADGEGLGGLELGGLVNGFAVADLGDEAVQEEGEGGEAGEVRRGGVEGEDELRAVAAWRRR